MDVVADTPGEEFSIRDAELLRVETGVAPRPSARDKIVITLQYHWLHIPTGRRGIGTTTVVADSLPHAHEVLSRLLDHWNSILPGVWQYWS